MGDLKRHSGGFTLLELLVVMTLLSVLMGGLVSAMRSMGQTEVKIDQRLERIDEMRTAHAFLMQTIQRVSASKIDSPSNLGKKMMPFFATAESLIWVGILPARPNLGGQYFFRLRLENVNEKPELVLQFAPCDPDMTLPNWAVAESRILVKDIQKFQVYAKGRTLKMMAQTTEISPTWVNGWSIDDSLPEQVKFRLTDSQGKMYDWTSPIYPLTQSDGTLSLVVVGGT